MQHDFSKVFDTDSPYWQKVLEIFAKNEKFEKKVVSNRNLHHKFPRSFSKKLGEPVDNDKDNLISLSLADHFLVHYYYYLLARTGFRQPMATAFTFMAKKGLKFMNPTTAEAMAEDYAEAICIRDKHLSEQALIRYSDPEERRKNSEMKQGKAHPHKWGEHSEEHLTNLRERAIKMVYDKATDFGRAYFEHYHLKMRDNRKLYQRERKYYKKFGRFSWDDDRDLANNPMKYNQKN